MVSSHVRSCREAIGHPPPDLAAAAMRQFLVRLLGFQKAWDFQPCRPTEGTAAGYTVT